MELFLVGLIVVDHPDNAMLVRLDIGGWHVMLVPDVG